MREDTEAQRKIEHALHYLHSEIDANPRGVYQFLIHVDSLDDYIDGNAINLLGILRDVSELLRDKKGLMKVLNLGGGLFDRDLSPANTARLHYTIGNAHSGLKRVEGQVTGWQWEDGQTEKEILHFRHALDSEGASELQPIEVQRTYTNLGNSLSTVGRAIEALDHWRTALTINPDFGPPMGQIGIALVSYAQNHYDTGHQAHLLKAAHEHLDTALDTDDLYPEMRSQFKSYKQTIEQTVPEEFLTANNGYSRYSLGTGEEKHYREWCLQNRLFLNSLNDISTESIAARDILHLPSVKSTTSDKIISCVGFYNQMKQEFVTARYQVFDGINSPVPHFSDKQVRLENTLDYPSYSLNTEQIKIGYRMAYSIFDKISTFIDYYFDLPYLDSHQLHFDKVWYKSPGKNALAPEFQGRQNWALRGLFWLSKDLEFGSEITAEESLEPGAEEFRNLRNELEHSYVKVHSSFSKEININSRVGHDELAHSIYKDDLKESTINILKKSRAALIYLALAIQTEEGSSSIESEDALPFELGGFDDDWKR